MAVLCQLPDLWDAYREYTFHLSEQKPDEGYACATLAETVPDDLPRAGHKHQIWVVTLFTPWLDRLSDEAVSWAIGHELGHVCSGIRCGQFSAKAAHAGGELVADMITRAWGFWYEEETFEVEAPLLHL
jgi:hypothetical protein